MDIPTPPASGGGGDEQASPNATPLIPRDQNTLSQLMTLVAESSDGSPYELSWKSHAEAKQLAKDLADAVATREDLDDDRDPKSARIRVLTREMNKAATRVKGYIHDKWESDEEAESYYSAFGFVEESDDDVLPSAQKTRAKNIETKLIPALQKHGLADRTYGVAWWQPRLAEYKTLTGESQQTAQAISGAVKEKTPLIEEARLYLSKFDSLLYAETRTQEAYLALRRQMGYLKEYN